MAKWLRRLAMAAGVNLLVMAAISFWLYRAATELPEDYELVLAVDAEQQAEARKELEGQLTALYSQAAQTPARTEPLARVWEASVTDAQINGWLATRLADEFPEAAQQGVVDPRVFFADDGLTLAFGVQRLGITAVVRFRLAPFVADDGRLGVELLETRIGAVPLPTSRVVEVSQPLLTDSGLPLEWGQVDGRPALLVGFETLASDARNRRTLSKIEYSEAHFYVAGKTERREPRVATWQPDTATK